MLWHRVGVLCGGGEASWRSRGDLDLDVNAILILILHGGEENSGPHLDYPMR